MKKTDKLKMGVVLTDTFKLRRKTQFDLFAEFMGKYKMDLDEIYNIYTDNYLKDLEKDLKKLDIVWICSENILPTQRYDKWNWLLGLEENYKENKFVIYDYMREDILKPFTKKDLK